MHGHQLRLARDVGKTLRFPTESHVIIEWLEHGWPTNDTGVIELLLMRSLPARLQGRPALHRLRAKDRGHADSRR